MKLFVALFSCLFLASCIIVTDRDEDGSGNVDWRQIEAENRVLIADLQPGLSLAEVRTVLGDPQYSESFQHSDGQIVILRYRTQHRHSDGNTSLDETTPLVFRNGVLTGWGETAMSAVM